MPAVNRSPDDWFQQQFHAIWNAINAASKSQQQFIFNPISGVCEVIIGKLTRDSKGALTGIGSDAAPIYGIASFKTGAWTQL